MAKTDLAMLKDDMTYISGMEEGVEIVKAIFALTAQERKDRFGTSDVANILDKFDFVQCQNILSRKRKLGKYYVLRGIRIDGVKKNVVWESSRLEGRPSDAMILDYLTNNQGTDFAVVEEIYVAELEK